MSFQAYLDNIEARTGKSPADPAFRKQRIEFLHRFSEALVPHRSAAVGARA